MNLLKEKLYQARHTILILGLLAVVIMFARLHTFNEPLERDITTYAVIGHNLLEGRNLYSDLWDHKPPAIFVSFALAELLVGYGPRAVSLLSITCALITLLGVYWAVSSECNKRAGLWAAAYWAVISGDLYLQANQPNTEVFLNAAVVWMLVFFLKHHKEGPNLKRALLVGALLTIASFYKQVALVYGLLFSVVYILLPPVQINRRIDAIRDSLVIGGVAALSWVSLGSYFIFTHRWATFYQTVFVYNRAYAGQVSSNMESLTQLDLWFPVILLPALPLVQLTLFGIVAGVKNKEWRRWIVFAVAAVATQIAIALPGWFYSHYYQLWLPLLAVGSGWGICSLERALKGGRYNKLPPVIAAATLLIITLAQLPYYFQSAESWSRLKYGNVFISTFRLSEELQSLLAPGETFYEWGNETGLYFYTRRDPPSGVFYIYPLLAGPLKDQLSTRVAADLEKKLPDLLILNKNVPLPVGGPITEAFMSRYALAPGNYEGDEFFQLFVLKGSKLEARLKPAQQ